MLLNNLKKDLYHKSKLYSGLLKVRYLKKEQTPLVANLFITGRCNSSCRYCYVEIDKNPKREFSCSEWIHLIDDLYAKGCRMYALVGGESFLHPHIDELIKHIASKNVFLNLTTNGYLLHQHLEVAKLATEVSISLDGDEKSHDLNRGKATFAKAMKGIELAASAGIKVRLCTVVTKHNYEQLDFLLDYAENKNFFITFSPLINAADPRKQDASTMMLSDEEIRLFFQKLKDAKRYSSRIINSDANLDYMINYPLKYGEIIWKGTPKADYYSSPCPYGRFNYLFASTGEVYPCCIMWTSDCYTPKNIFVEGLDRAIDHASNGLGCQCCSFANAVDWDKITSLSWLAYGIKMTLLQNFNLFGRKDTNRRDL
ncbi:MAG: radical SAM protein [Oligoflexia bacterium]|nr:radical SAM protein [Oligoflexia bacterium]MBF0364310.1 radical SAM protein [Oligoflexia bacterium]